MLRDWLGFLEHATSSRLTQLQVTGPVFSSLELRDYQHQLPSPRPPSPPPHPFSSRLVNADDCVAASVSQKMHKASVASFKTASSSHLTGAAQPEEDYHRDHSSSRSTAATVDMPSPDDPSNSPPLPSLPSLSMPKTTTNLGYVKPSYARRDYSRSHTKLNGPRPDSNRHMSTSRVVSTAATAAAAAKNRPTQDVRLTSRDVNKDSSVDSKPKYDTIATPTKIQIQPPPWEPPENTPTKSPAQPTSHSPSEQPQQQQQQQQQQPTSPYARIRRLSIPSSIAAAMSPRSPSALVNRTLNMKKPSIEDQRAATSIMMPSSRLPSTSASARNDAAARARTRVSRRSISAPQNAKPRTTSMDQSDYAADEEMRRMGSRRQDFASAAKQLDGLRQRAAPSQKMTSSLAAKAVKLNIFEKGEIIDYRDVYFCGAPNAKKHIGELRSQSTNFGYDDDRGDYKIIAGDHLAYRYEVVDVLGKGSFGQVIRCIDHKTGGLVAVKIIRNKKRFHQQALIEVNLLKKLKEWDPNRRHSVVDFTQSFYFRGHLCISTELLGMNLYELIKAHDFRGFSLQIIRRFTKQILASLVLLYQHRVIHCDLKPENILLVHPLHTEIKVIDFGSSCFENEKVYTYIQSRFYRSPEVILGMSYGMPIDMWSLGCIMAELYTGYPIFPGENEQEQLACIMEIFGLPEKSVMDKSRRRKVFFDSHGKPRQTVSPKGRRRRPHSKELHQALKCDDQPFLDFIARCLRWDPARRLNPIDAFQHEFITGVKPQPPQQPRQYGTLPYGTSSHARRSSLIPPLPYPPDSENWNGIATSNHSAIARPGSNGSLRQVTNLEPKPTPKRRQSGFASLRWDPMRRLTPTDAVQQHDAVTGAKQSPLQHRQYGTVSSGTTTHRRGTIIPSMPDPPNSSHRHSVALNATPSAARSSSNTNLRQMTNAEPKTTPKRRQSGFSLRWDHMRRRSPADAFQQESNIESKQQQPPPPPPPQPRQYGIATSGTSAHSRRASMLPPPIPDPPDSSNRNSIGVSTTPSAAKSTSSGNLRQMTNLEPSTTPKRRQSGFNSLRWDPTRRLSPANAYSHEPNTGVKPSQVHQKPYGTISSGSSTNARRGSIVRPLPDPPDPDISNHTGISSGSSVSLRPEASADSGKSAATTTTTPKRRLPAFTGSLGRAATRHFSNIAGSSKLNRSALPRMAPRAASGKPTTEFQAKTTSTGLTS